MSATTRFARSTTAAKPSVSTRIAPWPSDSPPTSRDAAERIPIAIADPLLAADDLFLREDGEVRLPRRPAPRPGEATPGSRLADRIAHGDIPAETPRPGDEIEPWNERLRIARAFVAAVRLDDRAQIEARFRALLAHQARYRIDATLDLPSRLGLVELLTRESHPDPELLRALLRDGVAGTGGVVVPGLERALLAARDRFTAPDFGALADRLAALAERAGVAYEDFFARAQEPPTPAPDPPADVATPSLVEGGHWVVRPAGRGRIEGARVDRDALIASTLSEMRDRGVLGDGDSIMARADAPPEVPLARLELAVESPPWGLASDAIEARFRWKVGLLLGSGAVALGFAALALAFQRQGRRVLELQSAFVSTVSHELRTPLATIRLLAETLERRLAELPSAKDYPARIVRAVDGLAFLVENLLSAQRLDRGRGLAERSSVKLDELLHGIVEDTSASLATDGHVDLSGIRAPTLHADPGLITVLFANLVRNAFLYGTRRPVALVVESERRGGWVVVRLTDNADGFGPGERGSAFAAFHRGAAATQCSIPGTGLGLSLCRRIVELHGGTITLTDTSPSGSTFELRFPASR
ncbi:MAG: HAMP domain-containing histidine kinase [Deltaproteobacteria bacterium]|nr:HAMP domain-containing histidine kinase [Deltaproteobacteria bacterium]